MKMGKKVLVGAGMAVFLTAASFVTPGGMLGSQDTGGVERPTPTATVTPFPTAGTVPVVTESPESASGESAERRQEKTRSRVSAQPSEALSAVRSASRLDASLVSTASKKSKAVVIKRYSFCGWKLKEAQRCIDQGKLVRYKPSGVNTLAGHNYKGWYWIDDIPKGKKVIIKSGALKGTYKVYGHAKVYNKKFPKSGLGADVALQTCEDSGIGFSFLRRV